MRMLVAALVLAAAGSTGAMAEETTVIHRSEPGVVVEHSAPAVVEHRTVESTSSTGCTSKTVRKTNDEGDSKTVHKESCD